MFKEDETQYCKNCYELQQQLDQLKAENEELASKCSQLEEENFELKEEVSIDRALFEEIDQLKKENEKLKEIAWMYEQLDK